MDRYGALPVRRGQSHPLFLFKTRSLFFRLSFVQLMSPVLRFATLLQLGNYLAKNQSTLTNTTLLLFSLQICKALVYLVGVNMVHR